MRHKKRILVLILLVFVTCELNASYQQDALTFQQQAQTITRSTSPATVPGFQTDTPPETNLNNPHTLDAAAQNVFSNNTSAQTLKRSAEIRPYFVLDLEKDPLFKHSKESVQNPAHVLRSPLTNRKPPSAYRMETCRESKPPIEFNCSKTLLPPTIHIDPAKYSHYWCSAGNHQPDDPHCRAKIFYPEARKYQEERVAISSEVWTSDCGTMDVQTKKRSCKLVKQVCPKGAETREIVATLGPERQATSRFITRPCWRYELTYACAYPSANTCEALRKSTCEQLESKCLRQLEGVCIEWEQTYRCPLSVGEEKETLSAGFSLPSQAPSTGFQPNADFQEAMAKLSIFKDIQEDMRANASSQTAASVKIFKGQDRRCTIAFAGFKNCCTDGKGWGVSMSLSNCSGEEKDLATRHSKGLCVAIGTYCAEKVLGVCTRKKKSHCCFPSKLSRLLQEQGRGQLSMGWGEAEHPECRGFSIEELSRINFDQLNLSELFAELIAKTKQITPTTAQVVTRNLSNRVSQMTHEFKNKPKSGGF